MPRDVTTPVLRNIDLGHGNFLLEFEAGEAAAEMRPAQFFMIGIPGADTLLRRPYSVCGLIGTFADQGPRTVRILYRVVGRGTSLLAALRPGASLTVLGPLGRGFSPPEDTVGRAVIVAGGIGVAPFPALIAERSRAAAPPLMFYGARSRSDLPLLDWFAERTESLVVTTEDGSAGRRGLVTEPLEQWLEQQGSEPSHLFVCGPEPMLQAVAALARARGVRCELSLEAHMACGFGVCLGCVVPVRDAETRQVRYDRVCVEGPVMPAELLAW